MWSVWIVKALFTDFMRGRNLLCLGFDGTEKNKHDITVGSAGAKDET